MKIVGTKITRSMIVAISVVVALIIILFCGERSKNQPVHIYFCTQASTNADCQNFLLQFGWKSDPTPLSQKTVTIPKEFDAFYVQYNKIQLSQGLDLTKYKGLPAEQKVFSITNYPSEPINIKSTLLIVNGQVVACDISRTDESTFMHAVNLTGTGMDIGQYCPVAGYSQSIVPKN